MSDSVSSLLGSAGVDPKIRKKGNKFVVEGVGEFDTYEDAVKALDGKTGDKYRPGSNDGIGRVGHGFRR